MGDVGNMQWPASDEPIVASAGGRFFVETVDGDEHRFRIDDVVFEGRTAVQHVLLVRTSQHGLMLVIDGDPQSAQADEFIYHEALVQPAMLLHPNPGRVLVVGGGEGATLREVLRHPCVETVTMIDVDRELIELSRARLGSWHQGAFDDPRTDLRIVDALQFLHDDPGCFDVIVVDVCDYVEGTAAANLYSADFFAHLRKALTPNGILAIQAGALGSAEPHGTHAQLCRLAGASFGRPTTYSTYIGSFWTEWGFMLFGAIPDDAGAIPVQVIDDAIAARGLTAHLRSYDGRTHRRMFNLPRHIRDGLQANDQTAFG